MHKLSKLAKAASVAALIALGGLAAPNAAWANGNWSTQLGPTGSGCFGWTNWTSDTVTAHIWQQSGYYNTMNACTISIRQYWRSDYAQTGVDARSTYGPSTEATVPNNGYGYYYYGPASRNGRTDYLCVEVRAYNNHVAGGFDRTFYGC
ncbi:hypothetical protein ABZW30_40485 [Kitasatospora sp. NPDC004669]|uniref:hypothetical protein n=1 Tax=Kitasatospora sp. NPDC004669 TaxID=3154555 RepID=UPI0033A77232